MPAWSNVVDALTRVISFNIIPLPVCLAERNSSLLPELIKKRRESSGPCRPLPVCPFGTGPRHCRPGSCASVPRARVRKAPCAQENGDRKSDAWGKGGYVSVDVGGVWIIK